MAFGPERRPVAQRLWKKVVVLGPDDCWEWRGWRDDRGGSAMGYGRIHVFDEWGKTHNVPVHRVAWMLTYGAIPEGLDVLHQCDNPPCCNPSHLFLGTDVDNAADRSAKDRGARGERSGLAKLTESDVREIRSSNLLQRELAKRFGVSQPLIGMIRRRVIWKHVV